ncbi:MAG TPA: hypothetical protein VJ453_01895 [Terriglobales bacterium]|jgi:hypothetical protein|nr:hypothetical protein [Terriglobales bacterium]
MLRTALEEAFSTLTAISGNLARLAYLASLQKSPGVYSHWGLARDYGARAVSNAFKQTHRLVLENMLQTDLAELEGELAMHAEDTGGSRTESLRNLLSFQTATPTTSGKHVEAHLTYVFASLQALAQHCV